MRQQISRWFLVWIIAASVFLAVLDVFIVNVALPLIRNGLQGSDADMQLIIALYLLGYASLLITGGRAGDHFGRRRVFIVGMLGFTLFSCVCGMAQTPLQLHTARFLQGISAALMIPQGIAYLQELFPEPAPRVKALGIYGSVAGAASVMGQFLGGFLPGLYPGTGGWRLIFLLNLPVGILAALLAWKYLPAGRREARTGFDYAGVVQITLGLMGLIYPLIRGREEGWPLWSLIMLVAAVLLLLYFVYDQQRKLRLQRPLLIDPRLFRHRDFNIALWMALFYFMVQDSYFLVNSVFLQTGLGISPVHTGNLFVSQGVGYVIASVISTRFVAHYGKWVLQMGIAIMFVGLGMHIWYFSGSHAGGWFWGILFCYGAGCGTVLPSLMTVALQRIPVHFAGAASGTYSTFQQTAVALGIGIVGGVFFYNVGDGSGPVVYGHAYQVATLLNMGLLVLVSIFLWQLPGVSRRKPVSMAHVEQLL